MVVLCEIGCLPSSHSAHTNTETTATYHGSHLWCKDYVFIFSLYAGLINMGNDLVELCR